MANNKVEEILCTLDKEGYIFPGYEIAKVNNHPVMLGTGGFSRVYEMHRSNKPENKYVLKVIGFESHAMTLDEFWNTVKLQSALSEQTEYICRLISAKVICIILDDEGRIQEVTETTEAKETLQNPDGIYIQFILMEKLEDIIERSRFGNILLKRAELVNEDEVVNFALQVGQALYYAHENNVLHRDVKLENIFWDEISKKYKLGDFGIAKSTTEGRAETVAYTSGYGAPELKNHLYDSYDATADIYSFGITLYLLLNEFKFPGSEGYYVNQVQYNPEFVFPAPSRASERMVRIIRKMCQYYPEQRYKSMAEVLMDLNEFKDEKKRLTVRDIKKFSSSEMGLCEDTEFWNRETETYKDEIELPDIETIMYEETANDEMAELIRKPPLTGRAERKKYERMKNGMYNNFSMAFFIGLTVVITLLTGSLQTDSNIINNLQFWVIPVMALVETILLKVKEFHIVFGLATLVIGVVMCITMGISVPYVILLGGIITGIPVISGACVLATVIWAVLALSEKLQWMRFIGNLDLDWILLVVLFFMMLHYLRICVLCDKITYKWAKNETAVLVLSYLLMIIIGIILLIVEQFGTGQIPEVFQRIHLVRTGLLLLGFYLVTKMYVILKKK